MDAHAHESMAAAQERHWWFQARRQLIRTLLRQELPAGPAGRTLLEIGSGTGGNLATLRAFGDVTAVEPAAYAVSLLQERFTDVTIVEAGWPEASASLGRFDAVLLLDVLEHLEDDLAALRAVRPHLAIGAPTIVTVPAYAWMWSDHDVQLWHKRRYSRRQLVGVATAAGFRVDRISGFNATLLPLAWMARRLGVSGATGDRIPAPAVNWIFERILRAEASAIGGGLRIPFGLSIVAVLRTDSHA